MWGRMVLTLGALRHWSAELQSSATRYGHFPQHPLKGTPKQGTPIFGSPHIVHGTATDQQLQAATSDIDQHQKSTANLTSEREDPADGTVKFQARSTTSTSCNPRVLVSAMLLAGRISTGRHTNTGAGFLKDTTIYALVRLSRVASGRVAQADRAFKQRRMHKVLLQPCRCA